MNEYNNNDNGGSYGYTAPDASAHYGAGPYGGPGSYPPPPQQQPEKKRKKEKKGLRAGAVIAICLVCSLLAAALGVGGTYLFMRSGQGPEDALVVTSPTPAPQLTTGGEPEAPEEQAPAETAPEGGMTAAGVNVYALAQQQVVGINTEIDYTNIFGQVTPASVSGTGFIISADGYIMTNNHVIEEARQGSYDITVLTYGGDEYTASIVGYDDENDIAVLKIDASGLNAAALGDSSDLVVGREVYAVGNPLGELNFTMTTGIISATDRAITTEESTVPINMFQIDAAVNSGNSGGPVYNEEGKVIGVVSAKTSATGVEGLGFAIPIEDAARIANQILEYGYVKDRATLGITAETIPESVAERYNMVPGAYVRSVTAGSPAEEAGLQEGDIITAVDGTEVKGSAELTTTVRTYAVGDTAQLTVWRSGQEQTLSVTFGESQKPVEATPAPQQPQQQYDYDDFFRQFFGGFGF